MSAWRSRAQRVSRPSDPGLVENSAWPRTIYDAYSHAIITAAVPLVAAIWFLLMRSARRNGNDLIRVTGSLPTTSV